jgi:hypothetical protein
MFFTQPLRSNVAMHHIINRNWCFGANLCRQQAEVVQNHENEHVRDIEEDEARRGEYKRVKLGSGEAYDRSND